MIAALRDICVHAAPAMPVEAWGVTAIVFLILLITAVIDFFTARVPDSFLFFGMVIVVAAQGFMADWTTASVVLRTAVAVAAVLWVVNELWYWKFRHDALGMGDAKWTMLAVACFGIQPAFYAWGVGAIGATIVLQAGRLLGYRAVQITFAPFLFVGLTVGLFAVH